jgi:hypothetical protein
MRLTIMVILLLITSCSTALKGIKNNVTDKKIEKFNITEFRNKKIEINQKHTEIKQDTIIEIAELNDKFIKNTRVADSPIEIRKTYYKENYVLKAEATYFHKFPVGISRKYDSKGKVIEEKDQDANYNFSVEALIIKMRSEFGIDIAKLDSVGVDRRYEGSEYTYVVAIPQIDPISSMREIKISGNTGNLISDQIVILHKK